MCGLFVVLFFEEEWMCWLSFVRTRVGLYCS